MKQTHSTFATPKFCTRFLLWALPTHLKDAVVGDLTETFTKRSVENPIAASMWFRNQAIRTALYFLFRTQKRFFMFIFSLIVFLLAVAMAIFLGGGLGMYFNVPSLLIVVPPALLFGLATSSVQTFKDAFTLPLGIGNTRDESAMQKASAVLATIGNSAMWMGWLGVILGAIAMAENIEPETFANVIGPATAVCLLTLFYAMIIKVLCYIAQRKLQFDIDNL